ncbi:hypothetical protein TRFO_36221 [Tritrichomonas foetus]|uniref:Uncharacterized protein n=1 Tax=Tritrichomonas foetus TaxID=1144522 RepID=A0A1J4JFV5_9EUKA|nr:hypothetical protein TRFO_36221 [Tritrichomonas foetus]|eukprot:OHS97537.1 hypothetical protein TRFO_36221 [Tritrichomonas foetus]
MEQSSLSPIPDKVTNAKINKLRDLRKDAINHHDFVRAQEIDKEITNVKQEALKRQREIIHENFSNKIKAHVDHFNNTFDRVEKDFDDQDHSVRLRYHKFFEDTQLTQKTELLNAEREFHDSLTRENLRRIPAHEKILEQSRKAATNGQYDEAIALKATASDLAKEDLEKRISAVEKDFIEKRESLFDQFKKVIEQLQQKFSVDRKKIEEKRNQALETENSNRDNQITATLGKFTLKLVQSGAAKDSKEAEEILRADLVELLDELGCPMPAAKGEENAGKTPTKGPMKNR